MVKGIVRGSRIAKNQNTGNDTLLLDVEITEKEDVQTIEYVSNSGLEVSPQVGDTVYIEEISESYKVAQSYKDLLAPTVSTGEVKIYSLDGTTEKATIFLKKDGLLELKNDSDVKLQLTNASKVGISNSSENIEQLLTDLIDEIKAITTFGSPTSHGLTPTSQTNLETIKTRLLTLFSNTV